MFRSVAEDPPLTEEPEMLQMSPSQSLILEPLQDADDVEVCVCARVRVCVCKGERGRERERERERVHTQSTLVACPL